MAVDVRRAAEADAAALSRLAAATFRETFEADNAPEVARKRGAKTMWLGVWERNSRAVAFYAKYGFTRVGEHTFMLGGNAQTDWLLARSI
ncbi:MAG TPA: GNAT family N-acetyltransferase [Vicinamibacterales bacterium]|nr:GNAT family N-acetyltransferase [Vicinamibacterales bacterium]